jgi:hypothetical protein
MTWDITGNRQKMAFGLRLGSLGWWGTGNNEPFPTLDGHGNFMDEMIKYECGWSLYPSSAPPICIDPAGYGLLERVRQFPEKSHAFIRYFSPDDIVKNAASIGIGMVVPDMIFSHINRILELVLTSPDLLKYRFRLDFIGLDIRESFGGPITFSFDDFYAGRPYFCEEIDLNVSPDPAFAGMAKGLQ